MRKFQLFSAVFFLFLLVPASITWAQVIKTLNGIVRYESGMSKSTFTTPNGDVIINLPQSLSGATITGTVSTEPAGKTEKEKSRNQKELLKYTVNLNGTKIPLSVKPANFDWSTSVDKVVRNPLELLNTSGVKVAEVSLPPVLSAPVTGVWQPDRTPLLTTPSNVLVKGDMLNVYTNQQFMPGEKFILTDSKGQQFTVKPDCLSSNQAVIKLPENAVPGELTVTEEVVNQPISGSNMDKSDMTGKVRCNLIDINLTSPNTNLRPGQGSFVLATISGLVWEDHFAYCIDLRNLNPNTVTMEGGNLQRVCVSSGYSGFEDDTPNDQAHENFQIRRNITGVKPGSFSVSATLHEDYTTSNDPFCPQLNVLKTPEDFNAWADALKKDLKEYATLEKHSDGDGDYLLFQSSIRANTQRAIDNMPVCTSSEQLDESKAVAYSLLQPLHVPKGAAISWLSSYEALKGANRGIENNTGLTDFDVLKNGIEFINRVAQFYKETALQTECGLVQEFIDQIQTTGGTKENLQELRDKINGLTARADMRIQADDHITLRTGMKDLILASYELPSLARPGRVHPYNDLMGFLNPEEKKLFVLAEYKSIVLSMIKAESLPNGKYHIKSMTPDRKPIAYDIGIVVTNQFLLFDEAGKMPDDTKKDEVKNEPPKEPAKLDKAFFKNGIYYFFYKDAECVHERDAKKDDVCTLVPGSKPDNAIVSYMKTEYLARGYCKKGTGTCLEMLTVDYITHLYADKNCRILLGVTSHSGYTCE